MTTDLNMDDIDVCTICSKQVADEPWYALATGDLGTRPHERTQVILCGECAGSKLSPDFRKTVKTLFEQYG